MDASTKKKSPGIRRYHSEVRRIAEEEGITPTEARIIYHERRHGIKSNGHVQHTEHAENGTIPGIVTEMMRAMTTLEANPSVAEYKRLLTAHSVLTE